MFKFCWDGFDGAFTKEEFEETVKKAHERRDADYVGAVRLGDLCFDFTLVELEPNEPFYLLYDLYIGGIDSGYGYKNGYPYDYFDGDCFKLGSLDMNYEDFKSMAEKELTDFIFKWKNTEYFFELIEKANEPLHIW